MKQIKILVLSVLLLLFCHCSHAQSSDKGSLVSLSGVVIDSVTNMHEAFASIYLYPQKTTVFSDMTGRFYIYDVSCETSLIVVKLLGYYEYKRVLRPIDFAQELIIRLVPKTRQLDTNIYPIIRHKVR